MADMPSISLLKAHSPEERVEMEALRKCKSDCAIYLDKSICFSYTDHYPRRGDAVLVAFLTSSKFSTFGISGDATLDDPSSSILIMYSNSVSPLALRVSIFRKGMLRSKWQPFDHQLVG